MRKGKKRPLDRLVALVARLRSPRGCPWDRKQTHLSLIPYLQEEARELAQALRRGDPADIEDELGDVLLQILLHSELARERGQ
ncbi:MAG TPA: MazG nucleotide pyrophosphohydrolase domain-containing protein, partial [Elusimicrobiota bacterium]|nr:MazG nucleotide pyrophosphohydrolase domain-containing protein [Elusimicrobiota bacterium]